MLRRQADRQVRPSREPSLPAWIFPLHNDGRGWFLTWMPRYHVAVAFGTWQKVLPYVHQDCHANAVYLNMKLENAFLEDRLLEMVLDFGLPTLLRKQHDEEMHANTTVELIVSFSA